MTAFADGRGGAVVVVQRFGGALNLNVHLHALVLDGVFTNDAGAVRFHPGAPLTREDVAGVVVRIARRVTRLERRGLGGRAEDGEAADRWSEEAPLLAAVAAASVDGRVALGPRAGARVRRCGDPPEEVAPTTPGPCHGRADGFDLHAGLSSAPATAIDWSGCAAMCCARRWPRRGCTGPATARSG